MGSPPLSARIEDKDAAAENVDDDGRKLIRLKAVMIHVSWVIQFIMRE